MNKVSLLLNAYYESLYERLTENKENLAQKIPHILQLEINKRGFEDLDEEKYAAYVDACLAFVDERIQTYDPVGLQYLFDRVRAKTARQLEMQLDWYDSRIEFQALIEAVIEKTETIVNDKEIDKLADELIEEMGAFPDKSIIQAYEMKPAANKLPDYVVARVIEELIR